MARIALAVWDSRELDPDLSDDLAQRMLNWSWRAASEIATVLLDQGHQVRLLQDRHAAALAEQSDRWLADGMLLLAAGNWLQEPAAAAAGISQLMADGSTIAGHIIDHGQHKPQRSSTLGLFGLHEQCLWLSAAALRLIADQQIDLTAHYEFAHDHWPRILRSDDSVHDGYTPLWIRRSDDQHTMVLRKPHDQFVIWHELVLAAVTAGMIIVNLPRSLRRSRLYAYHLHSGKALAAALDGSTDGMDLSEGQQRLLLRYRAALAVDTSDDTLRFATAGSRDRGEADDAVSGLLTNRLAEDIDATWDMVSLVGGRCLGPRKPPQQQVEFYRARPDIDIPVADAMQEIAVLERLQLFTPHRARERRAAQQLHRGWSSFVLHGLGDGMTEGYEHYGYASDQEAPYDWTPLAQQHCPRLIAWFNQQAFKDRYHRVRIMRLAPQGMVGLHNDNAEDANIWATNMAINNPVGCEMHFWDREWRYLGQVPWADGLTFKIRIGMNHCVINRSDKPRYHMIIHGRGGKL